MAVGNTFVVEKTCPICGEKTRVVKVRSRLMALQTDNDFCTHYQDFNPYYYTIWICEKCGYAADEKRFLAVMPEKNRKKIQDFLNGRKIGFSFVEERGLPEAVASFKLAIFYEELLGASLGHRAGLFLELAWIYRLADDEEKELPMLRKAAELYDQSLTTERYPLGQLTDTMAIYLVGSIYYRLGDYETATQYLSRIISDKDSRIQDRKLYERARYLWQDVRAAREAQRDAAAAADAGETPAAEAEKAKQDS